MIGRYDKVCFKGFLKGVGFFKRVLSISIYVDRPRSGYKGNKVSDSADLSACYFKVYLE